MTWESARQICACTHSAELASSSSSEENSLVYSLAGTSENTWIGGHDRLTEGSFAWSDGTPWDDTFAKTQWHTNQPNNAGDSGQDCLSMKLTNGAWDDVVCTKEQQFVCEKPDNYQNSVSNPGCSCDSDWTGSLDTKKCYKRGPAAANYETAKAACEADSGNLASVGSELENSLVLSVLTAGDNNSNGWLGATDTATDGTWVWDDGTAWDYQNWWSSAAGGTQGGTVQNCLQVRWADTTWDDTKCSSEKWYVCKK